MKEIDELSANLDAAMLATKSCMDKLLKLADAIQSPKLSREQIAAVMVYFGSGERSDPLKTFPGQLTEVANQATCMMAVQKDLIRQIGEKKDWLTNPEKFN